LHEIAKIIGTKAAKKDLFPAINKLLVDKSKYNILFVYSDIICLDSKVKKGAIKYLAKFYE